MSFTVANFVCLQGPQRHHCLDGLARDRCDLLEVTVVVKHRHMRTLGNRCKHQVSGANRTMVTAVRQEEHHLGSAVEVGLIRWDQGQRPDYLFMDLAWVASAEQGFEVKDAAPCHLALSLQIEELARDRWIAKTGVDAVVQQVRQSPHA